jgi:hypothetical protein
VLHHVGEGLGHYEVRARLGLRGEPLGGNVDRNREVDPGHDGVDAGPQTTVREDGGK